MTQHAHAYTAHGHPCCGQAPTENPQAVDRCGGPGMCKTCAAGRERIHAVAQPEPAAADRVLDAVRHTMLACVTCDNVHAYRKANRFDGDEIMTWGAPDGHPYRRRWPGLHHDDAEEIIRRTRIRMSGDADA